MYLCRTIDRSLVRQAAAPCEEWRHLRVNTGILRRWSMRQAEHAFPAWGLRIALSGWSAPRAVRKAHDLALASVFDYDGRPGFRVSVGSGRGSTPDSGHVLRDFLPAAHLPTYLDAILRAGSRWRRRDDASAASIGTAVDERGIDMFRRQVEHAWSFLEGDHGALAGAPEPAGVPAGDLPVAPTHAVAPLSGHCSFCALRVAHELSLVLAAPATADLPVPPGALRARQSWPA
jgi:sulfite reductase beta subunit-like hemoprotein